MFVRHVADPAAPLPDATDVDELRPRAVAGAASEEPAPLPVSIMLGAPAAAFPASLAILSPGRDATARLPIGAAQPRLRELTIPSPTLSWFARRAHRARLAAAAATRLRCAARLGSFEWGFSPAGPGQAPRSLLDRAIRRIDPTVARYRCEHDDLVGTVRQHVDTLRPLLADRITLVVGAADTSHLDASVRRFADALAKARIPAAGGMLPE